NCVQGLADERGELADEPFVGLVELTSVALVAELEEAVRPSVLAADTRGEPAAHRRMRVPRGPEVLPERVGLDLLLREAHHLAGRNRQSMEPEPARVDAEVSVPLVLGAQAEVLARLRRVAVDPQPQGRLLRSRKRPGEPAGPPEERVDALGDPGVRAGRVENGRDLDAYLARVHGRQPTGLRRLPIGP